MNSRGVRGGRLGALMINIGKAGKFKRAGNGLT